MPNCPHCDKFITRSSNLKYHIASRHSDNQEKLYQCDIDNCNFKCNDSSALRRHKEGSKHANSRRHACTHCDYRANNLAALNSHLVTHTGERRFKCDQCESSFTQKHCLDKHVRSVHSDEKPFKCSQCDYSCALQHNMVPHMLSHSEGASFSCKECIRVFRSWTGLQRHKNMHTGNRCHLCEYCGSRFYDSSDLRKHVMFHTGERPHKCDQCEEGFIRPNELKSHIFYCHTAEGQARKKKEEAHIIKFLEKHGFDFKPQHFIDFTCVGEDRHGCRAFIDYLITIKDRTGTGGIIFLEVDEHQHEWYEITCEIRRMTDVYHTLILEGNTLPILFVRYNPNSYSINSVKQSTPKRERESTLLELLNNVNFERPFAIQYMYYDTLENKPEIFTHPDYTESFKQLVLDPIV